MSAATRAATNDFHEITLSLLEFDCADCHEWYSLCRHTPPKWGTRRKWRSFTSEGSALGPMPAASLSVFAVDIRSSGGRGHPGFGS